MRETSPDVVCLQEIKTSDDKFPGRAFEEAGYGALWHGQRSHHGVAILAKGEKPVEVRRGLPGGDGDAQSRYLEAEVQGVRVASIYLPNGNPQPGPKFDYKLAWFKRLHAHARKLLKSGAPVIIAGDYNVAPTEIDIYPTKSWDNDALVQPESRAAYARLVKQGWTDALRELNPDERIYTFWHYWRNSWQRNAGLRIDHLLLSPSLAPRLKDAGVDRAVRGKKEPSDHAPVWVEIKDAPRRSSPKRAVALQAPRPKRKTQI